MGRGMRDEITDEREAVQPQRETTLKIFAAAAAAVMFHYYITTFCTKFPFRGISLT